MRDDSIARRLAALLIKARREHRRFDLAQLHGDLATAEEAYAIQDEVAAAMGWFDGGRATAWKAGASKPGDPPNAVPLPPAGVVASPAQFAGGAFHSIRIEGEIAFRFGAGAGRGDDWKAWIDELVVTIEVVDTRIADVDRASALVKLADAQQHGALVVGSAIARRDLDWRNLHATVRRNGETAADTRGGHSLGDPTVLLPWFVAHAATRGRAVRAGDLVTAGTWTGVVAAMPGDAIDVEFEGVGSAAARFL